MRVFVVLALISCAFAAPSNHLQRTKKSPFGCGGGQAVAPVALYLSPGIGQHYREDEAELAQREAAMMEHQHQHPHHHHHHHHAHPEHEIPEHARSYYEPAAAASIGGLSASIGAGPILAPSGSILAPAGHILASADSHSASAIFPGSKVGNCGVPLLLSCSPSVVSGHLAHGYAAPAYRSQDQDLIKREANEKFTSEPAFHASNQPQPKSWQENEQEQAPMGLKAEVLEHGFKREANEKAVSEHVAQASSSSLKQLQHESLDAERTSVGEAKWSHAKDEQTKPWSLERAALLDLQLDHKQISLQVPKTINDANVADNLNL